jgi:glycopeptide antibiotics resistance protein
MDLQIVINDLGIPIWPLGIVILLLVLVILLRRKHSLAYQVFFSLFWVYIMVALDKTFFPIQINGQFVDVMRQEPLFSQVNLVPMHFSTYGLSVAGYFVIINNILLTIPFGFGLNFLSRLRVKNIFWLSFAVGLGIETVQLLMTLILRYPYRVVDINDVWLNALGVLIGYGLFRAFARLYQAITHRLDGGHSGLLAYLSAVAARSDDQTIR